MKLIRLLIFILPIFVFSQKESANWYFGAQAGLNFNLNPPTPNTDGKLDTAEGCATISDINGNLLFYTDGVQIWDRMHQKMPNGSGLLGHSSSTESAIILAKPGSTSKYYVFTVDKPSYFLTAGESIDGVNYSEVDMKLNNGYGDVVVSKKNVHLVTYNQSDALEREYKCSEKITAVTHDDGASVWVVTQFMNRFYSFKVDSNGVNSTPVVSTVAENIGPEINEDGVNVSAIGYLKLAPDGKKIAIAHSSTTAISSPRGGSKASGKVYLYDFNNASGRVSNSRSILNGGYPYGVEFSPNSKLLYVTNGIFADDDRLLRSELYQYDLNATNIAQSRLEINVSNNVAGALQLAINGKIYRAGYVAGSTGFKISVINKPNERGDACQYSHNTVDLGRKASLLGLPPFVQSLFQYSFEFENICLGEQTRFYITSEDPYDSVRWNFGDGTTSTSQEPYHQYSQAGNYLVTMIMTINGVEQEPFKKEVIISNPPEVMSQTLDLYQCTFPEEPVSTHGTMFNLELANGPLTYYSTDPLQVYFYKSEADASMDETNINSLPVYYESTQPGEILYAKVYRLNSDCFSIGRIRLNVSESGDLGEYHLPSCDTDDSGEASFNFQSVIDDIKQELGVPESTQVSFYETRRDAALGRNRLPEYYTSDGDILYVRADIEGSCQGLGIVNLIMNTFPDLENQFLEVCPSDYPISIESGLASTLVSDYNYLWNTGASSNEIFVSAPGIYTIQVINKDTSCDKIIEVEVREFPQPEINDLIISDTDLEVTIATTYNQGLEFSVDNPFGGFQPANRFYDLPLGKHTLFVRDINSCFVIEKKFQIFGFPKFFTPNGDGHNDYWNVKGLDYNQFNSEAIYIKIYDRYGKILNIFQPRNSSGWDGRYEGRMLRSDDYWFVMELPNGEIFKGHFSLNL